MQRLSCLWVQAWIRTGAESHGLSSLNKKHWFVLCTVLYTEQARYDDAAQLLLKAAEGRRLKLGDEYPHTLESINNLVELYESWDKPEKTTEWRARLPKTEAAEQ